VLVLILILVVFAVSKKGGPSFNKTIPFECGFVPSGDSRAPFSIQFFLISLVFLVFDVELILLFPVLVTQLNLLTLRLAGFLIFVFLMGGGLIWE
jgi:NADH-ubiquinone oxidoreductase chain 3